MQIVISSYSLSYVNIIAKSEDIFSLKRSETASINTFDYRWSRSLSTFSNRVRNMPEFYQRSITFLLLITTIASTRIDWFDAGFDAGVLGTHSAIFSNSIELWIDAKDCPAAGCSCQVQNNATNNPIYQVNFMAQKPNMGSVKIQALDPATQYSFILTCAGMDDPIVKNFKTDNGRPSAPQTIATALVSERVRITWATPANTAGDLDSFRLRIDNEPNLISIDKNQFSYDMREKYVPGAMHTFFLEACNRDRSNHLICSNAEQGKATFNEPVTTTTTTTTTSTTAQPVPATDPTPTTSTKAGAISSSSLSFAVASFCLFLFHVIM